jgi:hypothetical protein
MQRTSDPCRRAVTVSGVALAAGAGALAVTTSDTFLLRLKLQLIPTVIPRFSACPLRPATSLENDPNTSTASLIE